MACGPAAPQAPPSPAPLVPPPLSSPPPSSPPQHRNIFWIIADDLRPELGSYGAEHIRSPNIDALATDSAVFERAYCQVPTCGASRASMLTGLYATPTRFINFNTRADFDVPDVPDLAKTLRTAGYTAISNGKVYHHSDDNAQSWSEICGHDAGSIAGQACNYSTAMCCISPQSLARTAPSLPEVRNHTIRNPFARSTVPEWAHREFENEEVGGLPLQEWLRAQLARWQAHGGQGGCWGCDEPAWGGTDVTDDGTSPATRGYPDGKLTVKVIDDLRRAKAANTPFFITCGFIRPHLPFVAPLRDWDAYSRDAIELADNAALAVGAPPRALHYRELGVYDIGTTPPSAFSIGQLMPEYGLGNPLPDNISRSLVHGYYASVTYVDRLVGRLVDELKSLGMYEETIVVFNSDHGYQLGEHGTWCKHSLFETSLHVPLIIKAPGFSPSRVPALVENIDIYPTLLDLVGIAAPPHLQGKSLVPLLQNPVAPFKDAVFSRYRDGDSVRFADYAYSEYCMRSCWSPETCSSSCATPHLTDRMLYDHTVDPDETLNRWNRSQYVQATADMQRALFRHRVEREAIA
ncbi:hypothetical protein EMIHUDRAFT_251085 [Emiliania huxleyi CCMP1516]|uniref:Sulfatase N-terminal domain-containing protein n=2 Tax=Emiliania huxleyi TaxID=2903 RepID=A0A0D3KXY4_EMIH1|nr:hypothetical protein EMIHUDRAFT_251085 [Emiliania huxleyi CCMP1516]EOD40619.1 hypothetical protein EMIHUDRAFT_251085 [Emiliania huxleyi CCMP1516]|eukprot:XP_005793048.1 hypothetical protein EMIHUDRAFT_251085 [Emiliania huxleyi CCMP1516]